MKLLREAREANFCQLSINSRATGTEDALKVAIYKDIDKYK